MIDLPDKVSSFYDVLIILEALEATSSYNEKTRILQRYQSSKDVKAVFNYTYNPTLNYYVRVPEFVGVVNRHVDTTPVEERWKEFQVLLQKLIQKEIVGNTSKSEVLNFLSQCTDLEKKWYTRIINRELRIGISENLIKKLWSPILPPIHLMLATLLDDFGQLTGKTYFVEPKYDGVRVVMMYHDNILQLYTRNGKRLYNIEEFLSQQCKFENDVFLDTECFLGNWNSTTSALFSLDSDFHNLIFYVFDILDYNTYIKKLKSPPLHERKMQLKEYLKKINCRYFQEVPSLKLNTLSSIKDTYAMYIRQGYEGAVIKDYDSLYEYKRAKAWWKVKEIDFSTVRCIDMLPGTGKYYHTLGAIVVQSGQTTFKVGSGFTDEQRNYYWNHKNEIIGKCIEISTNPSGAKTSKASFPVFLRIREDISEC